MRQRWNDWPSPAFLLVKDERYSPRRRRQAPGTSGMTNGAHMPQGTSSRDSEIDAVKASAHLPGLDIDIIHKQSPHGDWEQVSINLRATPSFEAFGRWVEAADPFALWMQAARLMWAPWLIAAQTMMLPHGSQRTPSGHTHPPQVALGVWPGNLD